MKHMLNPNSGVFDNHDQANGALNDVIIMFSVCLVGFLDISGRRKKTHRGVEWKKENSKQTGKKRRYCEEAAHCGRQEKRKKRAF